MKSAGPGAKPGRLHRAVRLPLLCLAFCVSSTVTFCLATGAARAEAAADGVGDLSALPLDALLDMEVTGASKFAQRASESAASVTVISAAEILALGHRTLADVLRTVRGVVVSDDHNYSFLGVRGFATPGDYNTRVLLLIDGNRVNDPVYSQASVGAEFPLDVELIERVEFIPGQGSSLYGANALFGVINVITKASAEQGHRASLALGSGASRQARVGLRREFAGGASLQVSASRQLSKGDDSLVPEPMDGQGAAGHADRERRSSVYLRAERGPIAMTLAHADRFKGAPTTLDLAPGDTRNFNRDSHWLLDTTVNQALEGVGDMTARAFVGQYRFEGQYVYDDASIPLNRDESLGRWWGLEARLFTRQWEHHKVVLGAEFARAHELSQKNHDLGPGGTVYLDDTRSGHRSALYVEDQMDLGPRLTLTAGARYDISSGGLRRLSPRAALNYRLREGLVLKLIHGSAYRQPNVYEAHYVVDSPAGYQANPSLRPETVRGTELAVEWRPDATSRLAGSFYANRASNLLALQYSGEIDRYMFVNVRPVRAQGLELEYERVWHSGARVRANLSLQHGHDGADLDVAANAPKRMGKLTALLPLSDDWMLGSEWQALSARGAAAGSARVNATLSRFFGHQGSVLSLSLYNLLDRRCDDPGSDAERQPTLAQPGRAWRVRWQVGF